MIDNRSVPPNSVMPVLAYADALGAADWLVRGFGFRVRLRIGSHRIQLTYGNGAVIVTDGAAERAAMGGPIPTHSVLVRVEDASAHHDRARAAGARIVSPPTDYPYGERQYSVEDPGGHRWTFSQSVADVDPADWGGESVEPGAG